MYIYFFFWIIRAFLYKILLGKIGSYSFLGKPIFIKGFQRIMIGKNVHIFPGLRMEATGKKSRIVIQDHVSIAQNAHITAGGVLLIKKNTSILANVCITDIDHQYTEIDINIRKQPYLINKTEIGENCMIGFGSVILAGTRLGNQCIIAANSIVRGYFPDYCVIAGAPAKIIKIYNPISKKWGKYVE